MNQQSTNKISNSEYDTLISKSLENSSAKEKSIATGKIISIENEVVTIDVGLKNNPDYVQTLIQFENAKFFETNNCLDF